MQQIGNSRSVLVTGATGFVGSNLVEALLQKGYSVTCLVRDKSNTRALQKRPVQLVVGDISDPEAIRKAGRAANTVYHVAGAIKAAGREQYFRVNQKGTRRLLETVKEVNPSLKRFVHVSSLAAAGSSVGGRGLTEREKPNPISWYGESKLASEMEVLSFAGNFPVTIIRPSAVYGPYDRETLLIFRMIKYGCLVTPGRLVRHFSLIHVEDLAAALIRAGEQDTPSGEIFFISRPETYTWEDLGRTIAQVLGKHFRQIPLPQWMAIAAGFAGNLWARVTGWPASINSQKVRELLEPSWLCDSSKARDCLGFRPAIDLEEGIRNTIHWYKNQGWL